MSECAVSAGDYFKDTALLVPDGTWKDMERVLGRYDQRIRRRGCEYFAYYIPGEDFDVLSLFVGCVTYDEEGRLIERTRIYFESL